MFNHKLRSYAFALPVINKCCILADSTSTPGWSVAVRHSAALECGDRMAACSDGLARFGWLHAAPNVTLIGRSRCPLSANARLKRVWIPHCESLSAMQAGEMEFSKPKIGSRCFGRIGGCYAGCSLSSARTSEKL